MIREHTGFRFDPELLAAMREIKATERIPISAQVELAVRAWLVARGTLKAVPKLKKGR